MRTVLCFAALIVVIGLPGLAGADDGSPPRENQQVTTTPVTPWYRDYPAGEACWGDSTESDADLNEGSRISTEEILRILNPAQS